MFLLGPVLLTLAMSELPPRVAAAAADLKTWHCSGWAPGKLCPGWTDAGQYRCDPFGGERGVCVNGWSKDSIGWWGGGFPNSTCGGKCGDTASFTCTSDWDCSLAGTCSNGKCNCDPWTTGQDCSYLNFKKIDKSSGLGYIDPTWSSWGGNAVLGKDGLYHLFMAEIGPAGRKGLGGWQGASQIAHAVSSRPDGPYTRRGLVAGPEHHNPTLQVSPKDGSWNLYSIKGGSGPIVVSTSTDQGQSWTSSSPGKVVSSEQNPGPLLGQHGNMTMWYRASSPIHGGKGQPSNPSACSDESIGVSYCATPDTPCTGGHNPVFNHTAEDPSVFIDHRGNYHMLVNSLPGGCNPKLQQGGHAWSRDGVTWSEPRVGAYDTTLRFSDGTAVQCQRRERPQIVLDKAGKPLVMFSGVVGCPKTGPLASSHYKGGGDCFTLTQLMNQ